jgi:hypothetical protein
MFRALLLGTWALLRAGRVKQLLVKASSFWVQVQDYGKSSHLAGARLGTCRACPMFDERRQTCGTVGEWYDDPDTGRKEPLGCWCFLPIKVHTPCNCWLIGRIQSAFAWPKELNEL